MDGEEKCGTMRSSEQLRGKATKRTTESQQGYPSDLQPLELRRERSRLYVPNECRQPLHDLSKSLDLKSIGAGLDWILPSQTKRLIELTKELGFEKGGQTLDWLISMATKPMLEVNKLLGSEDSSKAIALLLEQPTTIQQLLEQSCIAARNKEIPPTLSSPMNIPAQFPVEQFQTSTFQHPGGTRDHRGNQSQTPYLAGMPVELGVYKDNIVSGDTIRQNHGNQYFDQPSINHVLTDPSMNPVINQGIAPENEFEFENKNDWNQYLSQALIDPSMNPVINQGIAPENEFEFENIHDGNQYQSQGGTQMVGAHGGPPSEEQGKQYD